MRFTYSPPADALYVELHAGGKRTRQQELGRGIVADFDADDRLLGVEVLGASEHYPRAELEQIATPVVWLSLAEAAAEATAEGDPISPTTLRVQIRNGRLKAEKRGSDWVVARHELWNYLENRAPQGEGAGRRRRVIEALDEIEGEGVNVLPSERVTSDRLFQKMLVIPVKKRRKRKATARARPAAQRGRRAKRAARRPKRQPA